ncbi:hypothetical protein TSMG0008 [Halocynthia phage JM-2012]|uniref:hypothetical protein n=1 Tax=Halocynthia phage JM-2012 TaxID=1173297 RepID=UPI00025C68D7|nr:hypothetical protein TSMG0008 [Halocynthia phage JM-2012]AFI55291.1 hypothetical protein TSMG0008 [Halocynthia phage JM-2012]
MSETISDSTNALNLYIDSIELENFLGFSKPRIRNLKASFDKKLQILNSTNGCGKTTFISELNIFPIEKSLFDVGGYKIVRFRFNEVKYKFVSDHKRNYLYNEDTGENLNDGGTITQQLAIVKQLFGLTPFLWDAAMGNITFTDSDKNVRRTWIETISGIDFDYPFQTYKKITSELNSLKGAAKHINIQLTTEASKLLREEEVLELVSHKDKYSKLVKELLLSRDTSISKEEANRLISNIRNLEQKCKDTQLSYNRLSRFINPFSDVSSLESLRDYHVAVKSEIQSVTDKVDSLVTRLEDKTSLLRKLDTGKGIDITKVDKEISYFTDIQNDARRYIAQASNKDLIKYLTSSELALSLSASIGMLPRQLSNHLISDKDYNTDSLVLPYDSEKYKALSVTLKEKMDLQMRLEYQSTQMNRELSELDDKHIVECPECSTSFSPNKVSCDTLVSKIDSITKQLNKLEEEIKHLTYDIESYDSVIARRKYVEDYINAELNEDCIWYRSFIHNYVNEIADINEITKQLDKDGRTAYQLEVGLTSKEELAKLNALKKEHDIVKGFGDVGELDKEVKALEEEIASLRGIRKEKEDLLITITDTGSLYKKHVSLLTELKDNLTSLGELRERHIKVMSNVALEAIEGDLQVQLANVTKKVNDNEILVNLISSLQGMLDNTKERIERFKVLEMAFSPSTGLIAEQLIGYVDAFAKQLSLVIAKLWGYPLTILPCSIEGKKGMDYKFPFTVGGKPIPDVSKGSKSQVSVINLAVMLCTRISLGLNGLPLFLDEVGGGFDTVHNQKLASFIRELLANYGCSNVFLVHHDAAVRNSLGPRDTIVFDATQVIVEPNYNAHVKLTYFKEKKIEDIVH